MQKQLVFDQHHIDKSTQQKIHKEALIESQKEAIAEQKTNQDKLNALIDKSNVTLFKCSASWPFDLFPDEISVEPTQICIKRKSFFSTQRVLSVPIKNVADIIVQTTPFFASLSIIDRSFTENTVIVQFLHKDDAEKARKIIQGLVVASKEGIDLLRLDHSHLKKKVEEIGEAEFEQTSK